MIKNNNFRNLLTYDIIVPKANKADEFATLIEIVERELENFEKDEGNELSEQEMKQFVNEIYQQTLMDVVSNDGGIVGGGFSDNESVDAGEYMDKVIISEVASKG